MNRDLTSAVNDALYSVAPDLEGAAIDADADLQNDLGLDSMDSLNLVVAIKERTGVDIPDRELPHLRSVTMIVAYLSEHLDPPG